MSGEEMTVVLNVVDWLVDERPQLDVPSQQREWSMLKRCEGWRRLVTSWPWT